MGGIPCSIGHKSKEVILLVNIGPSLTNEKDMDKLFRQFLWSWGGEWMWNEVRNSGKDFGWVVTTLEEGTVLWVTNGSYMREVRADVSGVC